MDELTFQGESFISSKRAAQLTSYTKDYIGQLCRAEKLECKFVGRNWYVRSSSVLGHKQNFKKYAITKKELSFYAYEPLQYVNESNTDSTKILSSRGITKKLRYKSDNRLLNPVPNKKQEIEGVVRRKDLKNTKKPVISLTRITPRISTPAPTQRVKKKELQLHLSKTPKKTLKHSRGVWTPFMAVGSTLAFIGLLIMLFATEEVISYTAFPGGIIASQFQLIDAKTILEMLR